MANRIILNETSYFGSGAIVHVPEELTKRGFKKAIIFTDKELVKHNVVSKVTALLDAANIVYDIFDEIMPNPTIGIVKKGVEAYKTSGADCIIAIGGGSPIDTSKAIGIIVNNPEFSDVRSLEGGADTKNPCVPILAIPTTAGTAAEVTINYVITDEENKRKFVCFDPHDIPVAAFVDSDLMATMPHKLAAATGMDALTHAIEGYITQAAWEMTDMFHLKAIEMISRSLHKALAKDPKGLEDMSIGQYIAGMGFSNVGLGLVHGMAHPLGAWYDTPHGIANAIILPTVMEYNAESTGEKYRDIAKAMGENVEGLTIEQARIVAIKAVQQLSTDVGIPSSLKEVGVKEEDLSALSKDALVDVCTGGNPRVATESDILALYKKLM